jgi:hypothetical protein
MEAVCDFFRNPKPFVWTAAAISSSEKYSDFLKQASEKNAIPV